MMDTKKNAPAATEATYQTDLDYKPAFDYLPTVGGGAS